MELKLGSMTMMREYRDQLTGFRGVLVGYGTFLEGGDKALLQPLVSNDGKMPDMQWIPIERLAFKEPPPAPPLDK